MSHRILGALSATTLFLLLTTSADPAQAQRAGRVGVRQCDQYLTIYRCMIAKLPASSRAAAARAMTQMIDKWRAIARKGPAMRRALAKGCGSAVVALAKAAHRVPQLRGCIKGVPAAPPPRPGNAPPPKARPVPQPRGGVTGVTTCDALLARYRCFVNNLPHAAQASGWKTYRRLERTIASTVANARRKGRIQEAVKGCAAADVSMKKALGQSQYGKTCVGAQVAAPPPNTPTPSTDPSELNPSRKGLMGIPDCAAYIRMTKCFVSHLPGSAQRYAAMSLKSTIATWKKLLARGQRAQVIRQCRSTYRETRGVVARDPTSAACAR